jgi:putative SOS response-associated peptidase YedK
MRAAGDEIELAPMSFSFPPGRPRGPPVFNFRSEGRHFANSSRCIVPASAFFEFTGKRYPKAKHRFALRGSQITAIAAISRPAQGNQPPSFAMLTTSPGPDVAHYHNRQIVVLRPEDWAAWMHLTKTEAELLRPLPEGTLEVTTVREGRRMTGVSFCPPSPGLASPDEGRLDYCHGTQRFGARSGRNGRTPAIELLCRGIRRQELNGFAN